MNWVLSVAVKSGDDISVVSMRRARIKVPATESDSVYNCVSRTVNGEHLFDDVAKEILRRHLWQVADYCGVQLVTHSVMVNHFHALVFVPKQEPVSDAELLRRYRVLYPQQTRRQAAQLKTIELDLCRNGPEAVKWRVRQLALMGDISQYMKMLKQRFTLWFNKSHQRFGTLWAERFKSTLVEPEKNVLRTIAAYIDLNCVRAGLVTDPIDYRFCGYAEAVGGKEAARAGIKIAIGVPEWRDAQADYRLAIFGTGAGPRQNAASIPMADFERVAAEGGMLSLAAVLRCRLRFFTDGAVLGSRAFVNAQLATYRSKTGPCVRTQPRPITPLAGLGDFTTLRSLRTIRDELRPPR